MKMSRKHTTHITTIAIATGWLYLLKKKKKKTNNCQTHITNNSYTHLANKGHKTQAIFGFYLSLSSVLWRFIIKIMGTSCFPVMASSCIVFILFYFRDYFQHYDRCHLYLLATGASFRAHFIVATSWDKFYIPNWRWRFVHFAAQFPPAYILWVLTMFKHLVYTLFGALYLIKILPRNKL